METKVDKFPTWEGTVSSRRPRYVIGLPVSGFAHRWVASASGYANGAKMPTWTDHLGGMTFSQTTAAKVPTLRIVNNRYAVEFHNGGTFETSGGYPWTNTTGNMRTIVGLVRATQADTDTAIAWSGFNPYPLDIRRQANNSWRAASSGQGIVTSPVAAPTGWYTVMVALAGTNTKFYLNGVLVPGAPSAAASSFFTDMNLGVRSTIVGASQIAEVALHPNHLTAADAVSIHEHYKTEYPAFGLP